MAGPQPECCGSCPSLGLVQEEQYSHAHPWEQPWRWSTRHPAGCGGWGPHPWVAPQAGFPVPMHVVRLAPGTWAASSLHTPVFNNPGAKSEPRAAPAQSEGGTGKSPAVPVTEYGSTRCAWGLATPSLRRSPYAHHSVSAWPCRYLQQPPATAITDATGLPGAALLRAHG